MYICVSRYSPSGPSSLPEADQQLSVPRTVNRSMSDSGRGDPGHGDMGTRHGPVSISEVDLQQALSLALGGVQVRCELCECVMV